MSHDVDGMLIQWGDRLFYPGNRRVANNAPRLTGGAARQRAAVIRSRIEATAVRRAPQVMVKVTGGGRGMKAIAAHLRYISKNGRLEMEDDRGQRLQGRDAVRELADDWRYGGSLIEDESPRREAFNIMLSMPRGSASGEIVLRAARAFVKAELADHKVAMVLHDHQANPHVHISVRAESRHGKRLNPRKTDLHRWRETFAEKLRELGIDAEATRQATRGASRNHPELWKLKAAEEGRLAKGRSSHRGGASAAASRAEARIAWQEIAAVLNGSPRLEDRVLGEEASRYGRQFDIRPGRDSATGPRQQEPGTPAIERSR